jgi:hypothetical protein
MEHKQHLRKMLQTLRENQLYVRFDKCEFWFKKICIFGVCDLNCEHIYGSNESKDNFKWEKPASVTELRSFLDLTRYYRRFIKEFSMITSLLTRLTRKEVKFKCSNECEISFLVLTLPSRIEEFIVYNDAFKKGLYMHQES